MSAATTIDDLEQEIQQLRHDLASAVDDIDELQDDYVDLYRAVDHLDQSKVLEDHFWLNKEGH